MTYFSVTLVETSGVKRVLALWGDSIFARLPAGVWTKLQSKESAFPDGSVLLEASRRICCPVATVRASLVMPTKSATGNGVCFAHAARASASGTVHRLRLCRILWPLEKIESPP